MQGPHLKIETTLSKEKSLGTTLMSYHKPRNKFLSRAPKLSKILQDPVKNSREKLTKMNGNKDRRQLRLDQRTYCAAPFHATN